MVPFGKRLNNLIFGLVFLLVAACAPQSGSLPNTGGGSTQIPEAENRLAKTKWKLVSFGQVGREAPVLKGATITLEFNGSGQASGSGGCNSFGAQYQVKEDQLSFSEIISTLMACQPEGIDQQEQRFLQALKTASRFEMSGARLTIWYDNGQGTLQWVKSNA